jgi:hypothetical protein
VSVVARTVPDMSRPLDPTTHLLIRLSAICGRNRYTRDPAPVIAELFAAAGARTDLLARETGLWAGHYEDEHTATLVAAILDGIPGAREWATRA